MEDYKQKSEYFMPVNNVHSPAWSEEDERMRKSIIDDLIYYKGGPNSAMKEIHWLKSLKERYTWKPSDEQTDTLQHAIVYVEGCNSNFKGSGSVLEKLYNDLMKLRQEVMKEIVQFKESDKELIEAFLNLRKEAKRVFDMWDSRFNEIASAWREHRRQIIDEIGGSDSEEFDLTDTFYSNLLSMRDALQSTCKVLSDDSGNYAYYLKYIKPIDELREQEAKRIEKFNKCMKGE